MNRIIPILPCQSIKEQVAFYKNLGFETIEIYTLPNPFNITDVGGNTLFIGTPITMISTDAAFFRTIKSEEYAKKL
ncbi:MAG: hypothetical protein A2Y23_01055 [Clostridiales bacterium GWB2_37_7]|nr:MAG: hypothetical protein A2Y23_01055 [Clostridiales bacterium GWB2_37_7]